MSREFVRNEYFGLALHVSKCDSCQNTKPIFFWGGFVCRTFRTIKYFCFNCFEKQVKENILAQHKLGVKIRIKDFRNERLPEFLLELRDFLEGNLQERLFVKEQLKNVVTSIDRFKKQTNRTLSRQQMSLFVK